MTFFFHLKNDKLFINPNGHHPLSPMSISRVCAPILSPVIKKFVVPGLSVPTKTWKIHFLKVQKNIIYTVCIYIHIYIFLSHECNKPCDYFVINKLISRKQKKTPAGSRTQGWTGLNWKKKWTWAKIWSCEEKPRIHFINDCILSERCKAHEWVHQQTLVI